MQLVTLESCRNDFAGSLSLVLNSSKVMGVEGSRSKKQVCEDEWLGRDPLSSSSALLSLKKPFPLGKVGLPSLPTSSGQEMATPLTISIHPPEMDGQPQNHHTHWVTQKAALPPCEPLWAWPW